MVFISDWYDVEVRTDSMYAIKAIRDYAPNWRINADRCGNWFNARGRIISVEYNGIVINSIFR